MEAKFNPDPDPNINWTFNLGDWAIDAKGSSDLLRTQKVSPIRVTVTVTVRPSKNTEDDVLEMTHLQLMTEDLELENLVNLVKKIFPSPG